MKRMKWLSTPRRRPRHPPNLGRTTRPIDAHLFPQGMRSRHSEPFLAAMTSSSHPAHSFSTTSSGTCRTWASMTFSWRYTLFKIMFVRQAAGTRQRIHNESTTNTPNSQSIILVPPSVCSCRHFSVLGISAWRLISPEVIWTERDHSLPPIVIFTKCSPTSSVMSDGVFPKNFPSM